MEEKLCLSVRKAFWPKVMEYPTNDGLNNWGLLISHNKKSGGRRLLALTQRFIKNKNLIKDPGSFLHFPCHFLWSGFSSSSYHFHSQKMTAHSRKKVCKSTLMPTLSITIQSYFSWSSILSAFFPWCHINIWFKPIGIFLLYIVVLPLTKYSILPTFLLWQYFCQF